MSENDAPLLERLWIYQRERFPLFKTSVLLLVFTAASVTVSATLARRAPPGFATYLVAWVSTFILFFQLRASDEVKDFEDDSRFRPERPIPRGLVSLRTIVSLALALGVVAALLVFNLKAAMLLTLVLVWAWLALMSVEFFVPTYLRARPFLYLVSHMAIMPLIDLFVTSLEWLPYGAPPPGLWWFLGLSFANGCVLEIGRKVWAPECERPGVETYSSLIGATRAALLWVMALFAAFALLLGVGFAVATPLLVATIGALALALVAAFGLAFACAPSVKGQGRIEAGAGLWVFVCYGAGGFAPYLAKAIGA